jgi:hypothetical protein
MIKTTFHRSKTPSFLYASTTDHIPPGADVESMTARDLRRSGIVAAFQSA